MLEDCRHQRPPSREYIAQCSPTSPFLPDISLTRIQLRRLADCARRTPIPHRAYPPNAAPQNRGPSAIVPVGSYRWFPKALVLRQRVAPGEKLQIFVLIAFSYKYSSEA